MVGSELIVAAALKGASSWLVKEVAKLTDSNDDAVQEEWEDIRDELVDDLRRRISALEDELKEVGQKVERLDAAQNGKLVADFIATAWAAGETKREALAAIAASQLDPRISKPMRGFYWRVVAAMEEDELELLLQLAGKRKAGSDGGDTLSAMYKKLATDWNFLVIREPLTGAAKLLQAGEELCGVIKGNKRGSSAAASQARE